MAQPGVWPPICSRRKGRAVPAPRFVRVDRGEHGASTRSTAMIIRPHCTSRYVVLPNSLLTDCRLTIETRGMLALLLSKPRNWQLRPRPLMKELSREGEIGVGRTRLQRMLDEAMAAGYIA